MLTGTLSIFMISDVASPEASKCLPGTVTSLFYFVCLRRCIPLPDSQTASNAHMS